MKTLLRHACAGDRRLVAIASLSMLLGSAACGSASESQGAGTRSASTSNELRTEDTSDSGAGTSDDAGAASPQDDAGATGTTYTNPAQLEALLIGQWTRTSGTPELPNEVLGVELSADHQLYALATAADGTIARLPPDSLGAQSWSVDLSDAVAGAQIVFQSAGVAAGGTYTISAPTFSAGGEQMVLVYAPWPASYTRLQR